jgi:SAM-dependent methyltransferase
LTKSVVFDRATGFYDRTRALPAQLMRGAIAQLAGELRDRGPILEPGVGTGRMALPMADAGIEVIGLDLSVVMLAELAAKSSGAGTIPVVRGDATGLPFHDGAFGGAYVVHLLHLVPDWAEVVVELARVVRRGGTVYIDAGSPGDRAMDEVNARFAEAAGITRRHPGLQRIEDVDPLMTDLGARLRLLPELAVERRIAPERLIARLEADLYSWTWPLDEVTRRRAAAEVRTWASEHFGTVDEPQPVTMTIAFRAYDLP